MMTSSSRFVSVVVRPKRRPSTGMLLRTGMPVWLSVSPSVIRPPRMMVDRFGFDEDSFVVELASNDGYLLQYFAEKGVPVLGIEPTSNTAKVAIEKGIPTQAEFFGTSVGKRVAGERGTASLILGNNSRI